MSEDDLRAHLDELHRQLEDAAAVDVHVKDMFGSLMEDIVSISSADDDAADQEQRESVKQQLEEQAADFESRHPKLAAAIRQIMDLLAKMGI